MRLTKPSWVEHTGGEKKSKCPVYSMSVHPDGTRLATGGMDRKIKIWSTLPILDPSAAKDEANHKLLCTMSEHTGSVLAVRWAHHGRFLASGADDQVAMIWSLDPEGGGRLWGSDEVNVENWKPARRLVAHVADIIDMAWSRDDTMLASVGLDSTVIIWDGNTFERIKKLDKHQGFVKGVCWDPVGEFLATQSDDKTVKIWNTETWELVTTVSEPFANSGHATFFRRLSWSPDGAFIAASNAKNGPIFVAAVIDRDSWSAEISFVGHANTIQVAAFNPRLFFLPGDEASRGSASCMLALGADDFSISIWRNTVHTPIVVLGNVFEHSLLDLCWSNDGHHLYGCSEDGTICAISFDDHEIPDLGTPDQTNAVLKEFEYQPKQRRLPPPPPAGVISNGFGAATTSSTVVNVIQARKTRPGDQRRRINPSKPSAPIGFSSGARAPLVPPRQPSPNGIDTDSGPSMFDGPFQEEFASPSQAQASTARMFRDANSAFGQSSSPSKAGSKRKAGDLLNERTTKGRKMQSSSSQRIGVEVMEIRAARTLPAAGPSFSRRLLPLPTIQSILRAKPSEATEGSIYLEANNAADDKGKNMLVYNADGEDVWVDFLPAAAVAVAVGRRYSAVGCENGLVFIYSAAGRHISSMRLSTMPVDLSISGHMVGILTADSEARVINAKTGKLVGTPTSCSHLLDSNTPSNKPHEIIKFEVYPSGACAIVTSEPAAYALDPSAGTWIPLLTPFQLSSSPILQNIGPGGSLAKIESELQGKGKQVAKGDKPEWWDESLTLGRLEMRMKGAEVLGSAREYEYWVGEYAKFLGNEEFVGRAEELVEELIGSINSENRPEKIPSLANVDKRALLKRVMGILSQSSELRPMIESYEKALRVIDDGEDL